MKLFVYFSVFTLLYAPASATVLSDLENAFSSAALPKEADLSGYWAGRCVSKFDPDRLGAAVFVYKTVEAPGAFPPIRPTMSFYFHSTQPADFFDVMTPQEVQAVPEVKNWFQSEQWNTVRENEGSLSNLYLVSDSRIQWRSARLYQDAFQKMIVLRLVVEEKGAQDLQGYCYFNRRLGNVEPPQTDILIGNSGGVANQTVSFLNPKPETWVKEVHVTNHGLQPIELRRTRILHLSGKISYYNAWITVKAGQTIRLLAAQNTKFDVRAIDFYVAGATSNISVRGIID